MALKTFTGELSFLLKKKIDGRNGPITAYSGKITKADGEEYEEWVGFGFKKPECEQGDSVVITAKKEKGFWKAVDVEVTAKGDSEESTSESSDSGTEDSNEGSSARPALSSSKQKGASRDQRIHYQNSRTAAIQLADLLLKHKAVPLSATAGKGGDAARNEEVVALVNKLTVILYHDLETFRLVNDIEDVYEAPAKAETGFDGEDGEESDDE